MVAHGDIDGNTRFICGLKVCNNNRASTVLRLFVRNCAAYGIPSRVRGDRGGENVLVSTWMIMKRVLDVAPSFGDRDSKRNTRIERLWVEVGVQVLRAWKAFFHRLEHLYRLDPESPDHLWLLHELFLKEINEDIQEFVDNWNQKGVTGGLTQNKSPSDMKFLVETKKGKYVDPMDDVDPDVLQEFYGVDLESHPNLLDQHHNSEDHDSIYEPSSTPSDTSIEELDSDEEIPLGMLNLEDHKELEAWIKRIQEHNVRHGAVRTPSVKFPFTDEQKAVFRGMLDQLERDRVVPQVMRQMVYDPIERITVGKQKNFPIDLPIEIWWSKSVKWVRSLELMEFLLLQ
ncbi:hypothetical protein FRC03_008017 [Tulasnella sp. 419]|nr:hypothetical protein FRC03_008017 [Tulasnella sp. 419]